MTVMNESFESDERKRNEIIECLYWSLMNGWDIPKDIREHYGFSEDYELYHQLERLEPAEYRLKRLDCEVPDIVELDAQLKHTVENIFERLCPRPPAPYIDRLYRDFKKLESIAADPKNIDNLFVFRDFLVRYGIDRYSSDAVKKEQARKACKELNARLDRLTGRKTAVDDNTKEKEHKSYRKVHIPVSPKPKRRKMGL